MPWHMPTHGRCDIETPKRHSLWRVTVLHGGAGYHRQSGDELAPRPDIVMHRHDISTVGGPPRHANAAGLTPGETRSDMSPEVASAHHEARGLRHGGANSRSSIRGTGTTSS